MPDSAICSRIVATCLRFFVPSPWIEASRPSRLVPRNESTRRSPYSSIVVRSEIRNPRPGSGAQPAPSRPEPTKIGYSPELLEAQSSFVPAGSSVSAWIEASARAATSRSPTGITASASSS